MIKVSKINIDNNLEKIAKGYSSILENSKLENGISINFTKSILPTPSGFPDIPQNFLNCMSSAPKRIQDLKDGVIIENYEFEKGDEEKLGLLGFLNISLAEKEKVTVVEYMQHGSIICNGKLLKYGIGCRLMLRIKSHKRGAKLNTPQQITASVIFDKAEVVFSMRTFGITGPGLAKLNQTGTMSENTYANFMAEVSNLIVDMYNEKSNYIIYPQPLFLQ